MRTGTWALGDFHGGSGLKARVAPDVKNLKAQKLKRFEKELLRRGFSKKNVMGMSKKARARANEIASIYIVKNRIGERSRQAKVHELSLQNEIDRILAENPSPKRAKFKRPIEIGAIAPKSVRIEKKKSKFPNRVLWEKDDVRKVKNFRADILDYAPITEPARPGIPNVVEPRDAEAEVYVRGNVSDLARKVAQKRRAERARRRAIRKALIGVRLLRQSEAMNGLGAAPKMSKAQKAQAAAEKKARAKAAFEQKKQVAIAKVQANPKLSPKKKAAMVAQIQKAKPKAKVKKSSGGWGVGRTFRAVASGGLSETKMGKKVVKAGTKVARKIEKLSKQALDWIIKQIKAIVGRLKKMAFGLITKGAKDKARKSKKGGKKIKGKKGGTLKGLPANLMFGDFGGLGEDAPKSDEEALTKFTSDFMVSKAAEQGVAATTATATATSGAAAGGVGAAATVPAAQASLTGYYLKLAGEGAATVGIQYALWKKSQGDKARREGKSPEEVAKAEEIPPPTAEELAATQQAKAEAAQAKQTQAGMNADPFMSGFYEEVPPAPEPEPVVAVPQPVAAPVVTTVAAPVAAPKPVPVAAPKPAPIPVSTQVASLLKGKVALPDVNKQTAIAVIKQLASAGGQNLVQKFASDPLVKEVAKQEVTKKKDKDSEIISMFLGVAGTSLSVLIFGRAGLLAVPALYLLLKKK